MKFGLHLVGLSICLMAGLPPVVLPGEPCKHRASTFDQGESVMSALVVTPGISVVTAKRDSVFRLLSVTLCGVADNRELFAGDVNDYLATPFSLSDSTVVLLRHDQSAAVLVNITTGKHSRFVLPTRVEPQGVIRYVVGAVIGGRFAWRVNALRDSLPPLAPFAEPWLLGEHVGPAAPTVADVPLSLSAEMRVVARGEDLWAVRAGTEAERWKLQNGRLTRLFRAAVPASVAIRASPDGDLWIQHNSASSRSRWTRLNTRLERIGSAELPRDTRVLAAAAKGGLLVAQLDEVGRSRVFVWTPAGETAR